MASLNHSSHFKLPQAFSVLVVITILSTFDLATSYSSGEDRSSGRYTREIRIKQGSLRGLVLEPSVLENLPNVDMYLGIPYAAPPIGTQRFMPPGSPPQWTGVKRADRFGPVCPQNLPDFSSEPGKTMSEGRYNSLKRLLPYLNNQSEDCLYLNIYTPAPAFAVVFAMIGQADAQGLIPNLFALNPAFAAIIQLWASFIGQFVGMFTGLLGQVTTGSSAALGNLQAAFAQIANMQINGILETQKQVLAALNAPAPAASGR